MILLRCGCDITPLQKQLMTLICIPHVPATSFDWYVYGNCDADRNLVALTAADEPMEHTFMKSRISKL